MRSFFLVEVQVLSRAPREKRILPKGVVAFCRRQEDAEPKKRFNHLHRSRACRERGCQMPRVDPAERGRRESILSRAPAYAEASARQASLELLSPSNWGFFSEFKSVDNFLNFV